MTNYDDEVPVCRYCEKAIWLHLYDGEGIWRHFNGLMLCGPFTEDSEPLDPERVAEPMSPEEYGERLL